MKLEFVNHSSVVVEYGAIRLIMDPWLDGRAFNNGWDLITPTQFSYEDFSTITHIWFSHEHPDHFSPPNIKKIPEAYRNRIVVLFQETIDKKVVGYCRHMGFKEVIELKPDESLDLSPDVSVTCNPWRHGDAYLYLKAGDQTLINVNDCAMLNDQEISDVAQKFADIDLLLTQFSLSSWDGNPEDLARRKAGAEMMMKRIVDQTRGLGAKYVIPFASYIWFCHEENFYINSEANRVDRVVDRLKAETESTPVVMYPGDSWRGGDDHDSPSAIARHVADFESLGQRELVTSAVVAEDELISSAQQFCGKLVKDSGKLRMRLAFARMTLSSRNSVAEGIGEKVLNWVRFGFLSIRPARIFLHDLDQAYEFGLSRGLVPVTRAEADCDIRLGSDSLNYAFNNLFGGESLLINGRFSESYPEGRQRLFDYFYMANGLNKGVGPTWGSALQRFLGRA